MKFSSIPFDVERPLERGGEMLSKIMRSEREAHALKGYRFIFGNPMEDDAPAYAHKRACPDFFFTAYEMMRNARDRRAGVELFKNMNGEIACRFSA